MALTWTSLTRRNFVTGVGALAAGLAAKPRSAGSQATGPLRVRLDQDLKTLEPGHASFSDLTIGYAIFNRLIRPKAGDSWEWELDAAQSFEVVDPTHFKFTLRPGIQFTNGFGEMTADDVKFSYERMADPATGAAYDDWHMLDRVDVTDRYSGVIVTKEPNVMVMSVSLPHYRSSILSRKAMESVGGSFTTDPPAVSGRYTHQGVGPQAETDTGTQRAVERSPAGIRRNRSHPHRRRNHSRASLRGRGDRLHGSGHKPGREVPGQSAARRQAPLAAVDRDRVAGHEHRPRAVPRSARAAGGAACGRRRLHPRGGVFRPVQARDRDRRARSGRPPRFSAVSEQRRRTGQAPARRGGFMPTGFETTLSIINTTGLMTMAQICAGEPRGDRHRCRNQRPRIRGVLDLGHGGGRRSPGRTSSSSFSNGRSVSPTLSKPPAGSCPSRSASGTGSAGTARSTGVCTTRRWPISTTRVGTSVSCACRTSWRSPAPTSGFPTGSKPCSIAIRSCPRSRRTAVIVLLDQFRRA